MEFHIIANTCEEADKKMQEVISRFWKKGVIEFSNTQTEEGKHRIVDFLVSRGYIPLHLKGKNKKEIYSQLTEEIQGIRKIASHNSNNSTPIDLSHQKN